jgi:hypothetical protein
VTKDVSILILFLA